MIVNGRRFDVTPNLRRLLRYMTQPLGQFFWIDVICINQKDDSERSLQVRRMSETYSKSIKTASWVGLDDNEVRLVMALDLDPSRSVILDRTNARPYEKAFTALTCRRYWKRIWVQQEVLLQKNVIVCCGPYQQPLDQLLEWGSLQQRQFRTRNPISDNIGTYSQEGPVALLTLLVWFADCQCTDARDQIFALLSLMEEEECVAFEPYVDYRLRLGDVVRVTLRHIRHFSGQRRLARQLDSVLHALSKAGDSECATAVRREYQRLLDASRAAGGVLVRKTVSAEECRALDMRSQLNGEVTWLEIFRGVFSDAADPSQIRGFRGAETWVFDPPLSRAREDHLLGLDRIDVMYPPRDRLPVSA